MAYNPVSALTCHPSTLKKSDTSVESQMRKMTLDASSTSSKNTLSATTAALQKKIDELKMSQKQISTFNGARLAFSSPKTNATSANNNKSPVSTTTTTSAIPMLSSNVVPAASTVSKPAVVPQKKTIRTVDLLLHGVTHPNTSLFTTDDSKRSAAKYLVEQHGADPTHQVAFSKENSAISAVDRAGRSWDKKETLKKLTPRVAVDHSKFDNTATSVSAAFKNKKLTTSQQKRAFDSAVKKGMSPFHVFPNGSYLIDHTNNSDVKSRVVDACIEDIRRNTKVPSMQQPKANAPSMRRPKTNATQSFVNQVSDVVDRQLIIAADGMSHECDTEMIKLMFQPTNTHAECDFSASSESESESESENESSSSSDEEESFIRTGKCAHKSKHSMKKTDMHCPDYLDNSSDDDVFDSGDDTGSSSDEGY